MLHHVRRRNIPVAAFQFNKHRRPAFLLDPLHNPPLLPHDLDKVEVQSLRKQCEPEHIEQAPRTQQLQSSIKAVLNNVESRGLPATQRSSEDVQVQSLRQQHQPLSQSCQSQPDEDAQHQRLCQSPISLPSKGLESQSPAAVRDSFDNLSDSSCSEEQDEDTDMLVARHVIALKSVDTSLKVNPTITAGATSMADPELSIKHQASHVLFYRRRRPIPVAAFQHPSQVFCMNLLSINSYVCICFVCVEAEGT